MRRLILLAVPAVLALPATAVAAPAKISPRASAVSAAGVATVEVANPNRYVLRGKATVTVGRRVVATRTVRLAKRSVVRVGLRFDAKALAALRGAAGRATITLRVRRSGGRMTISRRTVTLRLPSAAPAAPAPSATPAPAPPAPTRWVGRMGTEGAYDDLELNVADGQMQITKPPTVPVSCMENGGSFRTALSFELFDPPGPWTVGADGNVAKEGLAVNQLVGSSPRTITYKVTGTTQDAARVAGTLGMSFSDSKLDVFTNEITFINCAGAQSFEAVSAG